MPAAESRRRRAAHTTVRLAQLMDPPSGRAPGSADGAFAAPPERADDELLESPPGRWAWLPPALHGARIAVDGRAAVAVVVIAVVGVACSAWFAWRGSSTVAAATPVVRVAGTSIASASASASSGFAPSAATTAPATLVVDVAGRVRRPGLVRVPAGARVADAVAAAGGALAGVDLASVNLARLLSDGEQVLVGVAGAGGAAPGADPPTRAGPGSGAGGTVDLNTATLEQLETLPGVGPVLAQRILDWRTSHGRFSSVDELREVGGIGDKKLADIAPKASV